MNTHNTTNTNVSLVSKFNIVVYLNNEHSKYISICRHIESFLIRCVNEKTQKHLHYEEEYCNYSSVNKMINTKCELDNIHLNVNEKDLLLTFLSKHKSSFYMSTNLI
jgi:hypothetical protein